MTCAGLDPKRVVSDRGTGDIVAREDTGGDDNRGIGLYNAVRVSILAKVGITRGHRA
jgi:hypothetical protein